jgi:dTDP-4-dehydrorhamnose reductase
MSRLLVLGRDGMLGAALAHGLAKTHTVTALARADFDIESGRWQALPVEGYDCVLNAAGLINKREVPADAFYTVNAVFPHALAAHCRNAGVKLIHFSTDCVFAGNGAPYYEDSPTDALDVYGRSKALGEPLHGMTLRTSIIGPEVRNGYNLMCWGLRQRAIKGFTNIYWNGVTTVALTTAIGRIIAQGLYVDGVRHLHSTDASKHDVLKMICTAFGSKAEITPTEWPTPRDVRLRTRHPDLLAALEIPPLERQLADLVPLSTPDGYWR